MRKISSGCRFSGGRAGMQVVTDPWLRNFIDLECFVLSGMPAKDTICAEMAFMFMERNKPDSTIDYPLGGSAALVDALVRGVEKNSGRVMLRAPVESVVMEGGRAAGVRLKAKPGQSGAVRALLASRPPRCRHSAALRRARVVLQPRLLQSVRKTRQAAANVSAYRLDRTSQCFMSALPLLRGTAAAPCCYMHSRVTAAGDQGAQGGR